MWEGGEKKKREMTLNAPCKPNPLSHDFCHLLQHVSFSVTFFEVTNVDSRDFLTSYAKTEEMYTEER